MLKRPKTGPGWTYHDILAGVKCWARETAARYEVGDEIGYEEVEELGDMEARELFRAIEARGLCAEDVGGSYRIQGGYSTPMERRGSF